MKFLIDQDVYALTTQLLRDHGHDVTTAAESGLSRASDTELLESAAHEGRILVTRDRHFGSLVFLRRLGSGVIYLRVTPGDLTEVHEELIRTLQAHSEVELHAAFVVIERDRHRFRRV